MTKVFTAGEVLTASDVNTYLVNTTGSGNAIINGAFEINQRNFTSTTSSAIYTFDRFRTTVGGDGSSTYTAQNFTPGTAPLSTIEGTNFLRIVTASQTAAGSFTDIRQRIEDVRNFAGQTATLSFFAKAASGTPKVAVEFQQGFGTGGSSSVFIYGGQVTLSTSWQRYSLTVNLPSITGKTIGTGYTDLTVELIVSAGSDFNARTGSLGIQSNTFDIWGVQLEAGTSATPFRRNANSIQGELAACQRYYQRITAEVAYQNFGLGFFGDTTTARVLVPFKTTMRTAPSFAASGSFDTQAGFTSRGTAAPTLTGDGTNTQIATLNSVVSGATAAQAAVIRANNSTTTYIEFSSEL